MDASGSFRGIAASFEVIHSYVTAIPLAPVTGTQIFFLFCLFKIWSYCISLWT